MFQNGRHIYYFALWFLLGVSTLFSQQTQIDQALLFQGDDSSPTAKKRRAELQLRESTLVDDKSKSSVEMAPSSAGDSDLGTQQLLKRKEEKYKSFDVSAGWNGFYTSNALLAKRDVDSDYFWVGQFNVSYLPKILPNLLGEVSFQEQLFRYDEFKDLDFDSMNMGGGLTYIIQELWDISVSGRYNFNRLTHAHEGNDGPENSEFFKNHTLTFTLQKIFQINRGQYWYVGHSSQVSMSEPVANQRNDYSLFCGYNASLTRNIDAMFAYRVAYSPYADDIREDIGQTISGMITYRPWEYVTISTNASLGLNNSNLNANDYDTVNTGVGVTARYRF